MSRMANIYLCVSLATGAALVAPPLDAQERGEEVVGSITSVAGQTLTVAREKAAEVRVQVTPSTQVEFRDSGDKKLFPNPGIGDLRAGMGVRFVYGTGTIDRIVVHYVPSGHVAGQPGPAAAPAEPVGVSSEQVKARVLSVAGNGRDLTADVAGRTQRFRVEGNEARRISRGDLVLLTVETRAGARVVTRIEPAEMFGTVTRVDTRGRTVSVDVDGSEQTYRVDNRDLLDNLSAGADVRFEVEERGSNQVIVALRRDTARR